MAENHIKSWKTHLAADRRGPREACFAGWSDVLHQRRRQPAQALPARRSLLADVDPACRPAASIALAPCPVRHPGLRLIKIAAPLRGL